MKTLKPKKIATTVLFDPDVYKKIRVYCAQKGVDFTSLVREWVKLHITG